VLEQLDPTAGASLARTGSAFLDVVYPRSIFPFGLPRAQMPVLWGVLVRVLQLVDFLGSAERLAWAKANGCPWVARTCETAARGGYLAALQWAWAHACPWTDSTCRAAARGGHLVVLQWALQHGCPHSGTCFLAASGGHLAVLRWAREHDHPWCMLTCHAAAMGGHLEVLKWARAHGCPWDKWGCVDVSRHHPETRAWVRRQPEY
jgi:hypothetical protein